MTTEQSLAATAVEAWKKEIDRTGKFFAALSDEQLLQEIAPGKNRLVYLFGHLIAVHDRMLPLLAVGDRLYPELDAPFLFEGDRSDKVPSPLPTAAALKQQWDAVHDKLHAGFAAFTAADWASRHTSVSEEDFAANPLRNRLAVLISRTAHVSYHLGQCVLAQK